MYEIQLFIVIFHTRGNGNGTVRVRASVDREEG